VRLSLAATNILSVRTCRNDDIGYRVLVSISLGQENCREWRQNQLKRLSLPMCRNGIGCNMSSIADIRASIKFRIGIEDFPPVARLRDADPIVMPWDGGHIADDEHLPVLGGLAQKGKDRVGSVVTDDPLKTAGLAIAAMQRGLRNIKTVQIANEALHAGMGSVVDRGPIKIGVMAPFPLLSKLPTHEQ